MPYLPKGHTSYDKQEDKFMNVPKTRIWLENGQH